MISITKPYCGVGATGDALRYDRGEVSSMDKRPIVVWNSTRRCNLKCIHCYADSENKAYPNELNTEEIQDVIRDLGRDIRWLKGPKIGDIGPITAETARESGLEPDIVAEEYTIEGLVRRLLENG